MSKIWCNETDCWFNSGCKCSARDVFVYDGECISCRYDKPGKGDKRSSRDAEEVRRDRMAKRVSQKIMDDMLERMHKELKCGGKSGDQD